MASKTLTQQLGIRYVNDYLRGSLFGLDGKICMLSEVNESGYLVSTLAPGVTEANARWSTEIIPLSRINGFEDFAWPKLGYRNLEHSQWAGQNAVMYLSTQRSTQRGLRPEHTRAQILAPFNLGAPTLYVDWHEIGLANQALAIFRPKFYSFAEGLKKLLAGDLFAFAVSEDIVVTISCDKSIDGEYEVRFKDRVVGTVDSKGNINFSSKVMNRQSLRSKLIG